MLRSVTSDEVVPRVIHNATKLIVMSDAPEGTLLSVGKDGPITTVGKSGHFVLDLSQIAWVRNGVAYATFAYQMPEKEGKLQAAATAFTPDGRVMVAAGDSADNVLYNFGDPLHTDVIMQGGRGSDIFQANSDKVTILDFDINARNPEQVIDKLWIPFKGTFENLTFNYQDGNLELGFRNDGELTSRPIAHLIGVPPDSITEAHVIVGDLPKNEAST